MKYIMLIAILGLFSCSKLLKITEANKQYIKKGIPSGKDYVKYFVFLEAKEDFVVDDIILNNSNEHHEFYYKDLSTGLSSYNKLISYPKGKYKFGFKTFKIDNFDNNDSIVFNYVIKGKIYSKTISVRKEERKMKRR